MDTFFSDLNESSVDVNYSFEVLSKGLIAAARRAKKQVGIYTTNGLIRGNFIRCKNASVIQEIVAKLNDLRRDGVASDSSIVKEIKRELRRLQRLSIYNKRKDDAFRLERLIHEDKPKFWKRLNRRESYPKKELESPLKNFLQKSLLNFTKLCFLITTEAQAWSTRGLNQKW